MKRISLILTLLVFPLAAGGAELPDGFSEEKIAGGLDPVSMAFAPDGRLLLCEKDGRLRIIRGETMLEKPALDLSEKVDSWNERGLLSVCFDPDFSKNGWLYLYYTHNREPRKSGHTSSNNRVSRFTMKGDVADVRSEKVILELNHLSEIGWHNGGGLGFGKDGKLYVSTGENAKAPNAQDASNLLGKLLRINADGSIPTDNPHYEKFSGDNRAIVGMGLRNGFSISVQPGTGLLYLSDVGAGYEQVEFYETGKAPVAVNYGWPEIDGPAGGKKTPADYRAPAYAYDHGQGKGLAICGGDFHNPSRPGAGSFPADFQGKFFFGDYGGWIKYIDPAEPEKRYDFADGINRALDVAVEPDGALWYIERAGIPGGSDEANSSSDNGMLWRVRWTGEGGGVENLPKSTGATLPRGINLRSTAEGELPQKLSATGIFTDRNLAVRSGGFAYSLNGTTWADGAEVRRWFFLPEGGKIGFSETGDYAWPGGSVFVQHFERNGKRLETRVLVLDETGAFGYGAGYRWMADGKDAELVPEGGAEDASQKWSFPARGLCFLCHTPNAGFVLGPRTHQLSNEQLLAWDAAGLFSEKLDETAIPKFPRSCKIDDENEPLEKRVRSYLATNCAQCHRPGGTGAEWDARFSSFGGIVNGTARNDLGIDGARLIVPGDVGKSLMHQRMLSTDPALQMPPATRNIPDKAALKVLEDWIKSLPQNVEK